MPFTSPTPHGTVRPTLLWVDVDDGTATYCDVLADQFDVASPVCRRRSGIAGPVGL
jgi:hypothetical protein